MKELAGGETGLLLVRSLLWIKLSKFKREIVPTLTVLRLFRHNETMPTPHLSLIVLRAADMERTLGFYQALGFTFQLEQHGNGPQHFSCDLNGAVLEIYPRRNTDTTNETTMLGWRVTALDAVLSELQKLGFEPKRPPQSSDWGRWVNIPDPDGRTIQLSES
jgi:predicted enzyme related to lactoylglutathione lyase